MLSPGLHLVIEGKVPKDTDEAMSVRLVERYAAQGWPVTVDNGAFTAPYRVGMCYFAPRRMR